MNKKFQLLLIILLWFILIISSIFNYDFRLIFVDFWWFAVLLLLLLIFEYSKIKNIEWSVRWLMYISFFITLLLFFKFYHFFAWIFEAPFPLFAYQPGTLFDDVRYSSLIIASITFAILMFFVFQINITKKKEYKKRLKFAILWVSVAILSHIVFYVSNLSYVYREYPKAFMYTSLDWEYITNTDRYFWLVEKYWSNEKWFTKFETLDDAIEALKLADKLNDKLLYVLAFEDISRFWYDKAFEKYQDKTFQVYFLNYIDPPLNYKDNFYSNVWYFDSLIENSSDSSIKKATSLIKEEYINYLDWKTSEEELFNFIREQVYHNSNLDNLEWVNYSIF